MTPPSVGPEIGGPGHGPRTRAQSEVLGTVLLAGILAVVVLLAGGLLLTDYVDTATGGPSVKLNATVDATDVTLDHDGGSSLALDDVSVVLRQDGSDSGSLLSAWTIEGDGDAALEPSERATTTHELDPGPVEVVVVHRPSRSVLLDETVTVETSP